MSLGLLLILLILIVYLTVLVVDTFFDNFSCDIEPKSSVIIHFISRCVYLIILTLPLSLPAYITACFGYYKTCIVLSFAAIVVYAALLNLIIRRFLAKKNYLPVAYDRNYFRRIRYAALRDNPKAQLILGKCYESGMGVSKDRVKSLFWFQKSADNGNKEALNWLRKAAENGHEEALETLRHMNR